MDRFFLTNPCSYKRHRNKNFRSLTFVRFIESYPVTNLFDVM